MTLLVLVISEKRCAAECHRTVAFDNNMTIVSLNFRLTALGKILEHAQNAKSDSNPIYGNVLCIVMHD